MLKKFKQATLKSLKTAGLANLVHNSQWRRQRLLILAYHGISLSDEHNWNGSQFISGDVFRSRLELLKTSGCHVLPLAEAVERLYRNDLPDRAVVLTFDDGTSDFARRAFPIIKDYGFPVTLYLTTFYSYFNRPVFDVMCSYLLWKGRDQRLDLRKIADQNSQTDLVSWDLREFALRQIRDFAHDQKLSAEEKDELAAKLAAHLKVDYAELLEHRVMHNLTTGEVSELAAAGVDIQLHTHRHRTPLDRELFLREIDDNRSAIHELTAESATHFCYPSGVYNLQFIPWLEEAGVVSATTCENGFASRRSHRLLLPRFLDNQSLSPIEFEGWLTGVSAMLPRRGEGLHLMAGGKA